uniref:Uncharacterized protein n=1 Tax=Panagrellus redivivus TaxID=6233 RepID=A0A7E4ZPZ1_PANRE
MPLSLTSITFRDLLSFTCQNVRLGVEGARRPALIDLPPQGEFVFILLWPPLAPSIHGILQGEIHSFPGWHGPPIQLGPLSFVHPRSFE